MPKDLGIDWKLIEADYLRGTRPVDICSLYNIKTSTLTAKIRRGGWSTKRYALRESLQARQTQNTMQTLTNKASGYLERVVKQVDRGLDVLEAQPPATTKEVDQHFEALGKIDRIARPALGLTDQGSGTKGSLINIAVLQQVVEPEPVKNCQDI